jgi:bifunctional UDP-N-acetylglucosamine pyrophosphorylase/glucosamine-1-phosphate N-acetyltransferase
VVVGDGAATGAGAVVRRDVPPGALAVSGGAQRNHEGWTLRKRPDTPGAAAAAAAVEATHAIRQTGDLSPPSSSELPDEGTPS